MSSIISGISIRNFRSFGSLELKGLSSFTILTGLNNAGKSNVLRALNLFFNGFVEPGATLDFSRDYNLQAQKNKKKKEISIEVKFIIPGDVKIRSEIGLREELKKTEDELNRTEIRIQKIWTKMEASNIGVLSKVLVNGKDYSDQQQSVEKFLSLFKFRYLPHGANPFDFLSADSTGFLLETFRRSRFRHQGVEQFLKNLGTSAEDLWLSVSESLSRAVGSNLFIKGRIPSDLAELIRLLPVEFEVQVDENFAIPAGLQGAGIQLYTALHLLYALDKAEPGRSFGWRQAFIWGVEEPENSLHRTLEGELAAFLRRSADTNNRFQILATTHSEIFASYAGSIVLLNVRSDNNIAPEIFNEDRLTEGLKSLASLGIGGYIIPILANPLANIIIAEGKTDAFLIKRSLECIGISGEYKVISPQDSNHLKSGGKEAIKKLLLDLWTYFAFRPGHVMVILDWDANTQDLDKIIKKQMSKVGGRDNIIITKLNEQYACEKISPDFKGIERFLSESFYNNRVIGKTRNVSRTTGGTIVLENSSLYNRETKGRIQNEYMGNGIDCSEIEPLKRAIEEILRELSQAESAL